MAIDDTAFYNELAKRDQAMADRWKTVSGKVTAKLTEKQVVDIIAPILKTGKISAVQADALNTFYLYTQEYWTRDAWDTFYVAIEIAYTDGYFFDGSGVQLVKENELAEVFDALMSA